jgi:hypothetical protein
METIARIWMRICKVIGWIIKGIRRTIRRMSPEQKRLCVMGIIALALGCFLGSTVGQAVEKKNSEKKVAEAVAEVEKKDKEALDAVQKQLYDLKDKYSDHQVELPWNMVLVNYEHPMKQGYIPELKELEPGYSVDIRIVYKNNGLLLRIRDDCRPFDPAERKELTDPTDPASNIGIRLVFQIADEVEYQCILGLNVLTIRI